MIRITYFSMIGYDENGTEDYKVETILCDDVDLEYYLNCIDENLILSID